MLERVVTGIREHAWYKEIPPEVLPDSIATMLAFGERQMLYWLARELPIPGVIVDVGAFIGGSTQALAAGFAANTSTTGKLGRIHTYDMFLAPRDSYSLTLIGNDKRPGDTVIDVFNANLGMLLPLVIAHVGDFLSFEPPAEPINLLFIDIAKSRALNEHLVRRYFRKLVPGKSILIQQDYNDHSCPWVKVTMEFFRDHFEYLSDESASRLYSVKKLPTTDEIARFASLTIDDEIALMRSAAASEPHELPKFFLYTSLAWLLFEKGGAELAVPFLRDLPVRQPWEGASYADVVIAAMEIYRDPATMDAFLRDWFKPLTYVQYGEMLPFPPHEYMALVCGQVPVPELHANFQWAGQIIAAILEQQGMLGEHVRLLDIGCGCGRVARYLLEKPLASYVGFDRHRGMIDWCASEISSRSPKFEFLFFDVTSSYQNKDGQKGQISATEFKFPFDDGAFDTVLLMSVFTHMPVKEISNYLRETHRVLSLQGAVLLSVFFSDGQEEIVRNDGIDFYIPKERFLHELEVCRFGYTLLSSGGGQSWYILRRLPGLS